MAVKPDYQSFHNEITNRGIADLIHFTPTLNLLSILEQGQIMSRSIIENMGVDAIDILDFVQFTDEVRYDDKSYINLSISAPNTFLLPKFMERTLDDPSIHWCVLTIDTKHIYDFETLFAVTNAASGAARNQYRITSDLAKFKMMFDPVLNYNAFNGPRRIVRGNIRDHYPTDIQAEVLVKDTIPLCSIKSVCFQNETDLAEAKAAMSDFDTSNFIVDKNIFNPNRSL